MNARAYYNEHDPFAAQWLRNLIAAGHIAPGDVDERDIRDVRPSDLAGYTQLHFFAGIGGWSYALRLAGVPDTFRIWTGSCPCQPFSAAGGRGGFADDRHLWPAFFHLIRECGPCVVLGEQVASKDGLAWLDLVSTDLEGEGYRCGALDTCAAGVGAPHIRQRLYWVADREGVGRLGRANDQDEGRRQLASGLDSETRGLADIGGLAHGDGRDGWPGQAHGGWRDADWLFCRDGKWRPVEPGTQPLAHGIPARVGRLRGYGNAIVPQVAQAFIESYLDCTGAVHAG